MDKTANCYLCNSNDFSLVANKEQIRFGCYGFDKQFLKCNTCGLIQLVSPWTEEELKHLYAQYSQKRDFVGAKPKQTISAYLGKYLKKADRILEIGCSFGDNLRKLQKKGYDVLGIDRDPTVCDGKLILNYDLKDYVYKGEKFDFIYAIHVFEHIANPRVFIEQLCSSLKENGRFLLEVPSAEDPLLRLYNIDNFKKFYWYPYHLFFYEQNTIEQLFREFKCLDVKIVRLQRYGLINHLRWLIFRRPGNFNPNIPLIDQIYKFILTKILKVSDTLVIIGQKKEKQQ